MFAKKIDVEQSDTSLKDLLTLALEGNEIILTEGDTPVIRLVPQALPNTPRILGLHPGAWMSDDFDAPLSDEFWFGEDQ